MSTDADSIVEGATLTPIFCTAGIPVEVLEEFVALDNKETLGNDYACNLTFLSIQDATDLSTITHASRSPVIPMNAPFLGWSVDEIYEYYKQHVQASTRKPRGWTSFTFGILDAKSVEDLHVLVCCDAPDFGEGEDEVRLKTIRMPFGKAVVEFTTMEMLSMTPSEHGEATCLSVMPPPWMDTRGFEGQAGLIGTVAEPAVARRNKRRGIILAESQQL